MMQYRYVVVSYKFSIHDEESLPLAAIAMNPVRKRIVIIGLQDLNLDKNIQGISRHVLENIRGVITKEVSNALKESLKSRTDFFANLTKVNRWNLHINPVKQYIDAHDEDFDTVVFKIFNKEVRREAERKTPTVPRQGVVSFEEASYFSLQEDLEEVYA